MSDNVEQRQQRRSLRGSILRACRRVYGQRPDTLTFESIHRGAGRHAWPETVVREEIAYLLDLEYLKLEIPSRDALDLDAPTVYRITAKGVQVLNGDLADASIEA